MAWRMSLQTDLAEKHLLDLAREHRIILHWRRRNWTHFEAHPATRMVFVGRPTSAIRYLGALHEMGHIVSPVARAARRGHSLTCEAAAWDWALDAADPRLMPDDMVEIRQKVGRAWATYLVVG